MLSGAFLRGYGRDVINIHHGLLPSFKGANPYRQAYDAGVKLIGATSHFVTEARAARNPTVGPQWDQSRGRPPREPTRRLGAGRLPLARGPFGSSRSRTPRRRTSLVRVCAQRSRALSLTRARTTLSLSRAGGPQHLDEGPIIEQLVERVSHRDPLPAYADKSRALEKACLARAVRLHAEDRVGRVGRGRVAVLH